MAPPPAYSASDDRRNDGFYMSDELESEKRLQTEIDKLKDSNLIPAIAGLQPTRKEMIDAQRGSLLGCDENLYKNVVRLNLDEESYRSHNRRAFLLSMMFVKKTLFSRGMEGKVAMCGRQTYS